MFVSVGDNSEFDLEFELGPSAAEIVGFPRRTIEFKARRGTILAHS